MIAAPDIISAVYRYRMLEPGDRVLVALSGGPDSVAMLHALQQRAEALRVTLHAGHLDHGLRGRASDEDAAFAAAFARTLGLPFTTTKARLQSAGEDEARRVRYEFLRKTAEVVGANRIAVGHTSDDRAESVLLNVIRGTGINGLGSIRPTQGRIIRPLILATRAEVETYLETHGLACRVDESNTNTDYTRNWVRHELLPMLRTKCNPDVSGALLRLADVAEAQSDLMRQLCELARTRCQLGSALDGDLLVRLHPALLNELIRSEIRRSKGNLQDITHEQILRVQEALLSDGDFKIALTTGRIYACRRGKVFRVYRSIPRVAAEPFETGIAVPGVTRVEQRKMTIYSEVIYASSVTRTSADEVTISEGAIVGGLSARNLRRGDRMSPFGVTGTKKLQDIFVDKKVPAEQRADAVVVCDKEKILWVIGVAASEAGRVTARDKTAIRLRAERDQ